ncbi:hypothetical protein ACTFIZ_006967 [Dictyostelium cf. discoideum]
MYSIYDFKFPSDWIEPAADDKCIYDCYKEVINFKLLEENKQTFQYYYGTLSSTINFYPLCNYDQLVIACRFLTVGYLVDDFLESNLVDSETSNLMSKKIENILIDGEYLDQSEISNIEKYTMFFRGKAREFVGDKINIFNQFIKFFVEWINSINPFNKAINLNNYDSYNFFKKVNSGTYVTLSMAMLLNPNTKVDTNIWMNPRFERFVCNGAYQMSAFNDCASYAKEIRSNCHLTNPLYFLQKEIGSFEQVYKLILNFNNKIVNDICKDEEILLKECPDNQKDDLKYLTSSMKLILGGNYSWSLKCTRFNDKDSPFIEQRSINNDVIAYENIVNKIIKS